MKGVKELFLILFALPEVMWFTAEPVQIPIVFWINILQCQRRRILVLIKQCCSSMLVNIIHCHFVPIIHALISKLIAQPGKEPFLILFTLPIIMWFVAECVQ